VRRAKQIGLNLSAKTFVGVWIENWRDAHRIGLSSSATIEHYPSSRTRAHLSAPRLTGPYAQSVAEAEVATTAGT
jgi:hypothetical protein